MRAPEADFEVSRIYWLGPLTILSSVAAVLSTRFAGLTFLTVSPFFAPLGLAPTIIDTILFVGIAVLVFTRIASTYPEPRRYYRRIAFYCLLVSFVPDLLLGVPWPAKVLLMTEHVAACLVTVELLTRLA